MTMTVTRIMIPLREVKQLKVRATRLESGMPGERGGEDPVSWCFLL